MDAINGRVLHIRTVQKYCKYRNLKPKTPPKNSWRSHKGTEKEPLHCKTIYLYSLTCSFWCPFMESRLTVVISQCYHYKLGGRKWDGLRARDRKDRREAQREREINIDSWESPLFLNYPCFPALVCVFERERVSCLAPLNGAQMPGGYRDIT